MPMYTTLAQDFTATGTRNFTPNGLVDATFIGNNTFRFADGTTSTVAAWDNFITTPTTGVTMNDGTLISIASAVIVQLTNGTTLISFGNPASGGITTDNIISNGSGIQSVNISSNDGSLMYNTGLIPDIWADSTDYYFGTGSSICFTRDTMIDTDQGAVAVQDLEAGMMVRTRDNGFQPIRWIGMSPTRDRAVRIKAGALGNTRDLVVSPRHRMVLDGWQLKMLFSHDHALVTALELVNDTTIVRDEMADVEYYHVMFDAHEVIFAEGAATESFHPDQASMGSMDAAAREEIFALFPELKDGSYRAEAAPNLSATQAAYVGKNLDAFVN